MDIDFNTDLTNQFEITLSDNPRKVSGNRALVNRFEITLLTKTRRFLLGDEQVVADTFGGDADKYINRPHVLNDLQSIAAAVETSMKQTVKSILSDQPDGLPNTEKLNSAELTSVDLNGDTVYAVIRIYPVEIEPFSQLELNLPIIKRN